MYAERYSLDCDAQDTGAIHVTMQGKLPFGILFILPAFFTDRTRSSTSRRWRSTGGTTPTADQRSNPKIRFRVQTSEPPTPQGHMYAHCAGWERGRLESSLTVSSVRGECDRGTRAGYPSGERLSRGRHILVIMSDSCGEPSN